MGIGGGLEVIFDGMKREERRGQKSKNWDDV
jgi:hypothetical protein